MSDKLNTLEADMAKKKQKLTREKRIHIRYREDEYTQLENEAASEGLGIGPYVRRLVQTHPERKKRKAA